jgi:gamma-glutamylcyclotransferase (GGCT)/AIG2-like uncharacterized protein YtfP
LEEPLFTYGTLSPADPTEADGWHADAVRGRMFRLGDFPGLTDIDDPSAEWVEGAWRLVDTGELEGRLDRYEEVDEGIFRRVRVETRGGLSVWVYIYALPIPDEIRARGPIARWDGRRVPIDETPERFGSTRS